MDADNRTRFEPDAGPSRLSEPDGNALPESAQKC